jgi:sugar phosphate isomerase/epimerase
MRNSPIEAFTLAERVGHEEVYLMLDFEHFMLEKEELSAIESCKGRIIQNI